MMDIEHPDITRCLLTGYPYPVMDNEDGDDDAEDWEDEEWED